MTPQAEHQIINDRYELERVLRTDGLGNTWRALDRQVLGPKDLRAAPPWADRDDLAFFGRKVTVLAHPGLVRTESLVCNDSFAAFVLEAFDGETIPQRRSRRPRRHFEVSEIKPWLRGICAVLEYLHQQRMPHGALHLGSVLIDGTELKLTDLAVSRLLLPQGHFQGGAVLPAAVMSPQLLEGAPPTIADDIYALGALIYDLLTGQPVFASGDIATQVKGAVPPSLHERRERAEIQAAPIPQAWESWIAAALAKEAASRPSLEELATLLRTGDYVGRGDKSGGLATDPPSVQTRGSTLVKRPWVFSANHLIIAGALLLAAVGMLFVYFGHIRPRNEFKGAMDEAFNHAQQFDSATPSDHAAVIGQWQHFEEAWQSRVEASYPEFANTLATAATQRKARETLQSNEMDRTRKEVAQRRKTYLSQARDTFEISRLKAASAAAHHEAAIQAWATFLNKYDRDFDGEPPLELADKIAEAHAGQQAQQKAIANEKKEVADCIARRRDALASLREITGNVDTGAAYKLTFVETYLAEFATAPASAMGDPQFLELKSIGDGLLASLRAKAADETPAAPLDIQGLFADSPCKDFSENGKKHLLLEAQTVLKTLALFPGTPDGLPSQATHESIVAFQKSQNVVPTAAMDSRTLAALEMSNLNDDSSPLAAKEAVKTSARPHKAKPPEDKSFVHKVGDGAKRVGQSIGNLFKSKD